MGRGDKFVSIFANFEESQGWLRDCLMEQVVFKTERTILIPKRSWFSVTEMEWGEKSA
jgi:hypothetical protein